MKINTDTTLQTLLTTNYNIIILINSRPRLQLHFFLILCIPHRPPRFLSLTFSSSSCSSGEEEATTTDDDDVPNRKDDYCAN